MDILLTNRKVPLIHSESVPRSRSKSKHIQQRRKKEGMKEKNIFGREKERERERQRERERKREKDIERERDREMDDRLKYLLFYRTMRTY